MQTLDADQEEKSRKGDERTQVRQKSRNGEELKRRGESTGMAEIEKRGREDRGVFRSQNGEAQMRTLYFTKPTYSWICIDLQKTMGKAVRTWAMWQIKAK